LLTNHPLTAVPSTWRSIVYETAGLPPAPEGTARLVTAIVRSRRKRPLGTNACTSE
jgi:hypothetical protein